MYGTRRRFWQLTVINIHTFIDTFASPSSTVNPEVVVGKGKRLRDNFDSVKSDERGKIFDAIDVFTLLID